VNRFVIRKWAATMTIRTSDMPCTRSFSISATGSAAGHGWGFGTGRPVVWPTIEKATKRMKMNARAIVH